MPGSRPQPVSVHHHGGERPAPDSLQQPHLTEATLLHMPVTKIGMDQEEQGVDKEQHHHQQQQAGALLPASDAVSLLLPGGLSSIFCRSGPPVVPAASSQSPAAPPALGGRSLQPYPRNLLQIVSDRRGAVPSPVGSSDPASVQPVSRDVGPPPTAADGSPTPERGDTQLVSSPSAGVDPAATLPSTETTHPTQADQRPLQVIEECIIPVKTAAPLLGEPLPPVLPPNHPSTMAVLHSPQSSAPGDDLRGPPDRQDMSRDIRDGDRGPLSAHQASPLAARPSNVHRDVPGGQAADVGGRSDASTVTAESDSALEHQEDDRLSVVSADSSWSDISGFEEDLWRLRSVLRDPTAPVPAAEVAEGPRRPPAPVTVSSATDEQQQQLQLQVHRLQLQLQHASQERQLYRQQLEALQGQLSGGSQRQQLEVQRQKARLEGVLEMTRAELEEAGAERAELRHTVSRQQLELRAAAAGSLRTERDALAAEAGLLRVRARELDAQLAEVAGKLETRAIELDGARDELKRSEATAAANRMALEVSRRELEGREATVSALKAKVAELVVDAQRQLQAKLRAEGSVQSASEELEQRQRSRDSYRDQLRASQEARLQQQQQLLAAQQELIAQQHTGERLRGELTLARQAVAGAQARAVREKETLLRHLENIQADMLQRESFFQTVSGGQTKPAPVAAAAAAIRERDEAVGRARSLELTIAELQQRLERSAEELTTAAAARTQMEEDGQKTRLALASTHEQLSQQTVQREQLHQRCLEGGQMLDQLRAQAKEASAARQTLKEEKTRLEVALASANQEKRDVDDAARGLTNELKKVSASFYKLKNDVAAKEKQIEELKTSLSGRESELRTATDKVQEASKLKLQAEQMTDKMNIFDTMNEQNKQLMVQNHELRYKVQQLTQDRSILEQGRQKLEEVVRGLQQQVNEAVQRETAASATISHRETKIHELEELQEKAQHELAVVKTYAKSLHREVSQENGEEPIHADQVAAGVTAEPAPSGIDDSQTAEHGSTPSAELEPLRRQLSLLSVENRELERRLQAAEAAPRLRQEHAALTARVADLSSQLQRARDADSDQCHQLKEQLQLSQTRNRQLQQQLAAAGRPEGVPASPVAPATPADASPLADQLAAAQAAYKERHRCYQSNIRVLTRKLREYMKALKTAERELAEWRGAAPQTEEAGRAVVEQEEAAAQLRRQLETAHRDTQRAERAAEQLRSAAADSQLLQLELEKERGRLEGMAQSYTALQARAAELEALLAGVEEQRQTERQQTPQQQHRLQEQLELTGQRLQNEQLDGKELRRQLFAERREASGLRRDLVSLQAGLQTAEDLAAGRQTQLVERQATLEAAQRDLAATAGQLTEMKAACDASQRQAAQLRRQTEQSQANDPVLAQQIKTLSGHLQQKGAELAGLQEQARLVERRHAAELDGLRSSLKAASEELRQLGAALDTTREEKFTLQTQVTELRAALQTSSTQVKALSGEISELQRAARLPQLPSPTPVDEAHISRLLEQSASGAEPRPLHHLQACLHSLKQEMSALQSQIHHGDPQPPSVPGTTSAGILAPAGLSPTRHPPAVNGGGRTTGRTEPADQHNETSPQHSITSPSETSAGYSETSPQHSTTSPQHSTTSPSETSAEHSETSPQHTATSADHSLTSAHSPTPPSAPDVRPAADDAPAVPSPLPPVVGLTNGGWRPVTDGEAAAAVDRFLETTRLTDVQRRPAAAVAEDSLRLRSYFADDGAPPSAFHAAAAATATAAAATAAAATAATRSEKETDV